MKIERLGQPIRTIRDWQLYAPPKSTDQWQPGRSALECASAWCGGEAPAVPDEIRSLLDSHPDARGTIVNSVIPEHPVRFDELRGEPRNTDVAALGVAPIGPVAISIEAKVDEPFGKYIGDMLADSADRVAHGERTEIATRVQGLLRMLPARLPRAPKAGALRYQLLTAVAGAIAFARENRAAAVLVVHEFNTSRTRPELCEANTIDLNRFVHRVSQGAHSALRAGALIGPLRLSGFEVDSIPLYIGRASRTVRSAVI